mmetsp:Transcript_17053/g.50908  ORF Transcript_17053/g.50908 Transcript_17053/m.50908 type:complete len:83 (+) Transcript_17053:1122-1370(+)
MRQVSCMSMCRTSEMAIGLSQSGQDAGIRTTLEQALQGCTDDMLGAMHVAAQDRSLSRRQGSAPFPKESWNSLLTSLVFKVN